MKNLVVNWHLLEPCQLKCKHCFAVWSKPNYPLIYKDQEKSRELIKEIASLADGGYVRLSIAGGEPLLDRQISQKIKWAREESLQVSIITNGDFLHKRIKACDLSMLYMLGVSIDSFSKERNMLIGRRTLAGRVPDYDSISSYLQEARRINPAIELKINTVVNKFNYDDDMSEGIQKIGPDKWKVLRVLPAIREIRQHAISDEQYEQFRSKHEHVPNVQFEDNDDMSNSYLMLDPYGRFFFNDGSNYRYSAPVLEVGIEKALEQVDFDKGKFLDRYQGEVK